MTFLVHRPGPPLDRAVHHFYCPAGPMPYRCEQVMPGPFLDLKINFGGPVDARRPGAADWEPAAGEGWCMGLWDRYHAVRWPADADFVGIAFRPGGFFALFGIEAHELGNRIVGLDTLLGRGARELRERLAEAPGAAARFRLLETLLAGRLRDARHAERIAPAMRMLGRRGPTMAIAELAAAARISHKHLVALFNRVAGAPPRTFARLCRLQHQLAAIEADEVRSWTRFAQDFGYFDQSHFNRDFKRLTGHSPAAYGERRRRARAADPLHAKNRRLLPQG